MNASVTIPIAAALVGILGGSVGMYWTSTDRIKREVSEQVTEKVTFALKIARLEERTKKLESDVWEIRTKATQ